jgi:hypothetical protein
MDVYKRGTNFQDSRSELRQLGVQERAEPNWSQVAAVMSQLSGSHKLSGFVGRTLFSQRMKILKRGI